MLNSFGLTPELYEHIKGEERLVLRPYLDPVGLPTIGYGHRIVSIDQPPLKSAAQAIELLQSDLIRFRDMALRLSPGLAAATPRRCAAILDFCFNAGGSAYAGSQLRIAVNEQRWTDAAEQNGRWVYGTDQKTGMKVKLAGLIKRRAITSEWLAKG